MWNVFNVGDLVWGRTMGSSYHPCVVSQDPYFRFHTKIVKAEPGIGGLLLHLVGRIGGETVPCPIPGG